MNIDQLLQKIGFTEDDIKLINDAEKGKDYSLEEKFNLFLDNYKNSFSGELGKLKDEEANSIRATTTTKAMKSIAKEVGMQISMTDIEKLDIGKFNELLKNHLELKANHIPDEIKTAREKNDSLAKQVIELQEAIENIKTSHLDEMSKKEIESLEKVNKFFIDKYVNEQIAGYSDKFMKGLSIPLLSSAFEKTLMDNNIKFIWDEQSKSAIPVDQNGNKGIKNPFTQNGSYASDFSQLFTAYGNKEKIFAKNNNGEGGSDQLQAFDKIGNLNSNGISDNTKSMAQKLGIVIE